MDGDDRGILPDYGRMSDRSGIGGDMARDIRYRWSRVEIQAAEVRELRETLRIAAEHLRQYRAYETTMAETGHGLLISHPYQPETLDRMIAAVL
jgi:hypothetical protein